MSGNLIEDQIFYGGLTPLIAVYGPTFFHFMNNTVRNVGYLNSEQQVTLPLRSTEGSSRKLPF